MTAADILLGIGMVPIAIGWATMLVSILRHDSYLNWISAGCFAAGSWIWLTAAVLERHPVSIAINGVMAIWNTYWWWKNRHNRKRRNASRMLGAKSRAVVEEMVAKLTPSPIPSPTR